MFNFKEETNLTGFTILIPSVSVGNIPQLTIDLLITSYDFQKVATIWHPAIVASVGGDPYESDPLELCTACELYVNKDLKLATIQHRSTLEHKLAARFLHDLQQKLVQFKIGKVVILSSAFDYDLHNVNSRKFFYTSTDSVGEAMKNIQVDRMEENEGKLLATGSGLGIRLYETFKSVVKTTLLMKFASEGDNRPDAFLMLEKLLNFIGLQEENISNLTYPSSWEFVFGSAPPIGIY